MDAEHLFRFRSQSCVFKFIRHSVDEALGPVHTMPDKFENATLFLRIRLPSTLIRIKRSTKTELFENALQSGTI